MLPLTILTAGSPRALTLTQLDTLMLGVLGGLSGLRMLDGPNRASAKNVPVRESAYQLKAQISLHTQPITLFPSGLSLMMRIQDDWCRMIKASPRPRAWLGLPRFRSDRLARGGWLLSYLWL